MAVYFNNPHGETFLHKGALGSTSDAVVTAAPLTMFAWFNPSEIPSNDWATIMAIMREPPSFGGYEYFALMLSGLVSGTKVEAARRTVSNFFQRSKAQSASSYSLDTWQSAAAVFASATSAKAYLNGVPGTEDTTSIIPLVLEQTYIGAQTTVYTTDHVYAYNNGCLAYCAIWDIALTDAEIASLHSGTLPSAVQASHLVYYVPLADNATRAQAFAWNGSSVAAIADMNVQEGSGGSLSTCASGPSFDTDTPDTSTDQPTTITTEQEYVVRQFIPYERPPFIEYDVGDARDTLPVPFAMMDQDSLRVTVDHVELLQSEFTLTTITDEYIPNKRGGSIELDTDAEDAIVRIWANPTPSRTTDLSTGQLNATRLNSAFETLWRIHLAHRYHLKRTQTIGPGALSQINETMSGNLFVI